MSVSWILALEKPVQIAIPLITGIAVIAVILFGGAAFVRALSKRKEAAAAKTRADAELLAAPLTELDRSSEPDDFMRQYAAGGSAILLLPTDEIPEYKAPENPFDDPYNPKRKDE
ncbi:hypothetical protein FACS1894208_02210 [Clostridia bacterium]|nr:hypothetical protein FACS1894208_02210 [Clostridia bacterium]